MKACFIHVPKTGGNNIEAIASRQYGPEDMFKLEKNSFRYASLSNDCEGYRHDRMNSSVKFLFGHFNFGFHWKLLHPIFFFSMVRDPLERAISDHYFNFQHRMDALAKQFQKNKYPLAYTLLNRHLIHQNMMADYFCGVSESGHKTYLDVVNNYISIMDLTESYDESLLIIAKSLGWTVPLYIRTNVTAKKPDRGDDRLGLTPDVVAAFKANNIHDYALYDDAKRRFGELVRGEGDALVRATAAFKDVLAEMFEAQRRKPTRMFSSVSGRRQPLPRIRPDARNMDIVNNYLLSSPPIPAKPCITGCVDRVDHNGVDGWVRDLNSDAQAAVDIVVGGEMMARVAGEGYRGDVKAAHGSHGYHGFSYSFPRPLPYTRPCVIEVRVAGTLVCLPGGRRVWGWH